MIDRKRTRAIACAALAVCVILVADPAAAARKRRATQPVAPAYDTRSEVTVRGTVDDVLESVLASWRTAAQRIVVATDEGPVTVELAPSSFLKARYFSCVRGDTVELVGSRVPAAKGEFVVLARELRRRGASLTLRDAEGRPVWNQPYRQVTVQQAAAD